MSYKNNPVKLELLKAAKAKSANLGNNQQILISPEHNYFIMRMNDKLYIGSMLHTGGIQPAFFDDGRKELSLRDGSGNENGRFQQVKFA
jgi:hypothetical protein